MDGLVVAKLKTDADGDWTSIVTRDSLIEGTRLWDEEIDLYLVENNAEIRAYLKRKKKVVSAVERDFPHLRGFLPGDLVYVTLQPGDTFEDEFHNRQAVVTYGPDNEGGYLVSGIGGSLRCLAEELTLIVGRDDRSHESDVSWQKEEKWKAFHEKHKRERRQ